MSTKKTRADSILGTLTEDRQAEVADYARTHTLVETVAWLRADGLKTSRTALGEWLSSWSLSQRFKQSESSALQFKAWLAETFPKMSEEELDGRAAMIFQFEALKTGDPETYLAFASARHKAAMDKAKFEQKERLMQFDEKKFAAQFKTKIEAGLDALFQEIKGNAEARSLFEKFKAVISKATA
jgi:hypothetical protein